MKLNEIISMLQADDQLQALIKSLKDKPAYDAAYELCKPIFEKHRINPTANVVRGVLKRGSNTTIEKAIIAFRDYTCERLENIPEPVHLPFPTDMLEPFAKMWQSCTEITNQAVKDKQAELKLAQTDIQTLTQTLTQSQASEKQALEKNQTLEKMVETLQASLSQAQITIEEQQALRQQSEALLQSLNSAPKTAKATRKQDDHQAIQKQLEHLQNQLLSETQQLQSAFLEKLTQEQQAFEQQKKEQKEHLAAYQEKRQLEQEKREKKLTELKHQLAEEQQQRNQLEAQKLVSEKKNQEQADEITRLKRQIDKLLGLVGDNHPHNHHTANDSNRAPRNNNYKNNRNNNNAPRHKDIGKIVEVMLRVYEEQINQFGQVDLYDYKMETGDALRSELGLKINANQMFEQGKTEIERQGKKLEFAEK